MSNCKEGDIAVITWDEEPVFSNIGLLVNVSCPCREDPKLGLLWQITPVNYEAGHLFIDGRAGNAVKANRPGEDDIWHPDAWMRPITDPDKSDQIQNGEFYGEARQHEVVKSASEAILKENESCSLQVTATHR